MTRTLQTLALGCFVALQSTGASAQGSTGSATSRADLIVVNGAIYTVDPAQPWAEAVAIRDGRYVVVGTNAEARAAAGADTKVVDLGGAMAMPGLVDAHVHPTMGAGDLLYSCQFASTATPDQIAAVLPDCLRSKVRDGWLTGGRWGSSFFDDHRIDSPKAWLDRYSTDVAIVFEDDSAHNAWVNSKALERLGWDRSTPDPEGGRIVRDANGEPTGLLLEGAAVQLLEKLRPLTAEQYRTAVRKAIEIANGYGIVAMKDAWATPAANDAYKAVDDAGDMTMYTVVCLETPYGHREVPADYAALEKLRERNRGRNLRSDCVKIFMDGVPTPARTAAMLEPYLDDDGKRGTNPGEPHVPASVLNADLVELDRRGFTVKIHAAGDRAVRMALDAVEAARKANGQSGLHHEIAHAGFIDPTDVPRFHALDVVADLSPYIWTPSPIIESIVRVVGPRGDHYWPIRELVATGAPLAAGSDWPAVVPTMDPWSGIEGMVTRKDPRGTTPGTFWAAEAIPLETALRIFTLGGARALRIEDRTGSIAVGKSADFVVLDQHLFKVAPDAIGDTKVEATYFQGKRVYAAR